MNTFITGFSNGFFTLTGIGYIGLPNTQTFDSVHALDFYIEALERSSFGVRVLISPAIIPAEFLVQS